MDMTFMAKITTTINEDFQPSLGKADGNILHGNYSKMSTQEEASQYNMVPAKQDRRLIMSDIIADYENVLLWFFFNVCF